jgi:hypothetical protein
LFKCIYFEQRVGILTLSSVYLPDMLYGLNLFTLYCQCCLLGVRNFPPSTVLDASLFAKSRVNFLIFLLKKLEKVFFAFISLPGPPNSVLRPDLEVRIIDFRVKKISINFFVCFTRFGRNVTF